MFRQLMLAVAVVALASPAMANCPQGMKMGADNECHAKTSECGPGMKMGADNECHAKTGECGPGMKMGADHECHPK